MRTRDLDYRDGDVLCRGYLAAPDEAGHRPGILVVHEAWGLGEHAMDRARMLADAGYVALAADIYGERTQCSDLNHAIGLIGELRGDPRKLRDRAKAALDALAGQDQVDRQRQGAIGFCFGGTTVLELARAGLDLAGVVSFHGGLDTTAPAEKGRMKAKILVCTGAEDPMIQGPQIQAFEDEMRKAGADWTLISYGGAKHGFTNPDAHTEVPGVAYHEATDKRSWTHMKAFFDEAFRR